MSRLSQRIRSVVALCTLSILFLALGAGCPTDALPLNSASTTSISVDIVSGYSWYTGETRTAAALVYGATGTVTYQWSITPPGLLIGSANDLVASFTASTTGSAILLVTATDSGTGTSATNAMEVTFQSSEPGTPTTMPSEPLTVDAGPDQTVAVGYTVLLLGSASGGYGNYIFEWRQASGPAQTTAPQFMTDSPAITVIGTTPGTAVFELIVRDYLGETATRTVRVMVTGPPD